MKVLGSGDWGPGEIDRKWGSLPRGGSLWRVERFGGSFDVYMELESLQRVERFVGSWYISEEWEVYWEESVNPLLQFIAATSLHI